MSLLLRRIQKLLLRFIPSCVKRRWGSVFSVIREFIRSNLLVQVFIEVPKKVNAEQERLLRELAELDHELVLPHRKSFLENLKNFFDPETDSSES